MAVSSKIFHTLGAVSLLATLMVTGPVQAQDSTGQSLESAANDPTASLMSFQFQTFYSPNVYSTTRDANVLQFRAAIPFEAFGLNHIARLTVPYVTKSASGASGLGDTTLFDLAAFDRSWGRFGVGAVALMPTGASGVSAEQWALGPAFGFVAQTDWGLAGLFNQNLFSLGNDSAIPDVNISTLQPIVNVSLGSGWSAGTSEMTFAYDWNDNKFTSVPLGVKVSKLTKMGGLPVQFQLSYEHNFYDTGTGPENTIGLTVKLLVPR